MLADNRKNRSGPDLVHIRQADAGRQPGNQIWPRSGSHTASRCWQTTEKPDLAQIWLTYGKPVLADNRKPNLAQIWFTYGKPVLADNRKTRSGPDLVHIRQAGASSEPVLPELNQIRAGPAGYLGTVKFMCVPYA